jgi:hypothetical protein
MSRVTVGVLTLALAIANPTRLMGQSQQQLRVGIARYDIEHPESRDVRISPGTLDGTYWKIGAVLTGLPAAIAVFAGIARPNEAHIVARFMGAAIAGAIFALPGALIGAQFKK